MSIRGALLAHLGAAAAPSFDTPAAASGKHKKWPVATLSVFFAASMAVLYLFPHERQEFAFALVGAAVFAAVELSKPSKICQNRKDAKVAIASPGMPATLETLPVETYTTETLGECMQDDDPTLSDDGVSTDDGSTAAYSSLSTSSSQEPPASDLPDDEVLIDAVGCFDARTRELVALVQRWAEQSGLADKQGAHGKLSTLAWQVLAVYFLQVFATGTRKIPAFDEIMNGGLPKEEHEAGASEGKSVLQLFRDFIEFYAVNFDWQNEGACVRSARRGQPRRGLMRNALADDDGFTTLLCPSIENPFQPGRNLGNFLSAGSFQRIHEELMHADSMCKCGDASGAIECVFGMLDGTLPGLDDGYAAHLAQLPISDGAMGMNVPAAGPAVERQLSFRDFMTFWLMMPQSGVL